MTQNKPTLEMKIVILIYSFLCLSFGGRVHAQDMDNITPKGINSIQEYNLIRSDGTDELRLLLLLNEDISDEYYQRSKKVFDDFFNDLEKENIGRFSEANQIKKLHAIVHDRFLKKYEEIPLNFIQNVLGTNMKKVHLFSC